MADTGKRGGTKESQFERTQRIISAPVIRTLLSLSWPNLLMVVVHAGVNIAETYFVSLLGPEPLAGIGLGFPLFMIMYSTTAIGFGGAVSSSVARALGANDLRGAEQIAFHAVVLAVMLGLTFTILELAFGRALLVMMGGTGGALESARTYTNAMFAGGVASSLYYALGSILRGSGNMRIPAIISTAAAVVSVTISPVLIFGAGPIPPFGIAGVGITLIGYNVLAVIILLRYLRRPLAPWRLPLFARLQASKAMMILSVGFPSMLNSIVVNITMTIIVAFAAQLGTATLAGIGTAVRLEYTLLLVAFGFGMSIVTMVGMAVGAIRMSRARAVAWKCCAFLSLLTGAVGVTVAVVPDIWMSIFIADPEIKRAGAFFLNLVGPAYVFIGVGASLYYASQGLGRPTPALAANCGRFGITAVGGAISMYVAPGEVKWIVASVACGLVFYGSFLAIFSRRMFGDRRASSAEPMAYVVARSD
jgi:putative MATE family efflux protein